MAPDALPEPIAIAVELAEVFDRLRIPYLVGGSLASSVHGEPRSTNDVDIVADLQPGTAASFVEAIEATYYVSESAIREAIATEASFNVIHLGTALKVDIFLAGRDPFNAERLRHRVSVQVARDPSAHLFMDSAEHSVLRKLEWFRRGGEQSERQWRDVLGILRVQGDHLDDTRLAAWASHLRIADLLTRAREQAGRDPRA